jgi:hypothetical protein
MSHGSQYSHTQKTPIPWIVLAVIVWVLIDAAITAVQGDAEKAATLVVCTILFAVLSACFSSLTVQDKEDGIQIRFGPIPLIRRTVRYGDIRDVEVARTSLLDGWGIHRSIRGGWIWNIWGRHAVLVTLDRNRKLWIGTDEPDSLEELLRQKVVQNAMSRMST